MLTFAPCFLPLTSFSFSEDQVHEAAKEGHGEADPRQDVGGAIGALVETGHVKALVLSGVDGRCDHHT